MKENIKQYHETYFMIIIQTILVILKLLNVINWKWVYVFIPLYIYLAIIMFLITLVFIIVKDVPYDRNGEIK